MVSPQRHPRSGRGVLHPVAVGPPHPPLSATLSVPLPRVPDFLPDPSPERRAQGSALSLWVPQGAPEAKFHSAQRGLLPHCGRQREKETAKRQARPRGWPRPAARGRPGDALRRGHRPLSGHGGQSDREAAGKRVGDPQDVGKGGETTPHGPPSPNRLCSALPHEQQFLGAGWNAKSSWRPWI